MNELIKKALAGDKQAEKEIFERLTVRFRFIAKRYIAKDDAEDIAQEACVTIIEKYKDETFDKGFEPWAYGVLRMKIGNYFQRMATVKKNIVDKEHAIDRKEAISEDSRLDLRLSLINCLKKINVAHPQYARALNLVHQGYTTDEVCDMLQIKSNYLYVILNRGRKMLKTCLESTEVYDG